MLSHVFGQVSPAVFARRHFGDIRLCDRRRTQRVVKIAEAMASHPGASIPTMHDDAYAIKAAYTLFDRDEATPDALQAGHRELVGEQLRTPGQVFVLPEDTSELSWSGNLPVEGLGPAGNGARGLQGFKMHSVLAMRWPELAEGETEARRPAVEILGLADQQYYARQGKPAHERRGQGSQKRKHRRRESQVWNRATERLGPAPEGIRWVRVCDREADIYEFILELNRAGHGYVIRAAQDRVILEADGSRAPQKLFEHARALKPLEGRMKLDLRRRPAQKARGARLALSAGPVRIQAPQEPHHGPGWGEPVACFVARIFEPSPPEGVEALEWIVLTDRPVDTFAQARETALQYSSRWVIEEFHKALKTGLGAERLQLETADRLFAAIAIMSVVALRLIDLRERARVDPQAPANKSGLSETELKVLRMRLKRPIETVGEVALAVGRLGGHMNRRLDGMPGWKTLWLGMLTLKNLVEGFLLFKTHEQFGE